MDSIECSCGARTACWNLAKKGEKPIIFVGGSHKHGQMKISNELFNEAKVRCLWCGTKWPKNMTEIFKTAI